MEIPRSLRIAAGLVAVECVALTAWGAIEIVRAFTGHPHDRGTAVLLGVVVLLLAAIVGLAARGLLRARRWAQAPTYLAQFFAIVIAIGQLHTLAPLMVPLIVVAAGVVVAVSWPDARATLGGI